jgi:hypothetical protein
MAKNETQEEGGTDGDVSEIDYNADAAVGGNQYPFLEMGPEGGAGCTYVAELVESAYWRAVKGNKKGPQRFKYTVRVMAASGEGAAPVGALRNILFLEDEWGYYMRDNKAACKAFTGKDFGPEMANALFNKKHDTFGQFNGSKAAVQVTRNAKNPQFPSYVFEGPVIDDVNAEVNLAG